MARFRKPFFKKSHGCWYVQLDGRQVRLSPDRDEAHERYHELMRERKRAARLVTPGEPVPVSLGDLLDRFLSAGFAGKAVATKAWYADKLTPFADKVGRPLPAKDLQAHHLDSYAALHPDWKPGTVRNLWRAVQRMCRWGHRRGLVPELGLLGQEKPRGGRRDVVIPQDEFKTLLAWVRNDHFRALLTVCWETAARPQEVLRARVRHLDRAHKRLVFQPEESKDKDAARVVYLTDRAFELLNPGPDAGPADHLLTNTDGRPWTTDAVNCAFAALHKRMTKAGLKARKYCLYHLRHSWLDRKLKGGVDAMTAALLMGHRDPSQVARTYQHLTQSPDYLRAELNRDAG